MVGYIGKSPTVGNFVKLDSITTSATTTFNLLNGGVAYSPENARVCQVSLNGVIQNPETAYNIVGSTIVFSTALTSDDVIDYILVLGDVMSVGTPSDATVSTAKIVDDAVTEAKLNLISTSSVPSLEAKGDGGSQDGYIQLNCSQNSHGIKIKSAPHSASASYTLTLPNNDGNAGEFLKTDGSGVMSWDTAGGGKVGQVVQTVKTDIFTSTTASLTDVTGFSVSITPSATSSKVLVMAQYNMGVSSGYKMYSSLLRGSTEIYRGDTAGNRVRTSFHGKSNANDDLNTISHIFLDSPNTTSATTYKIQAYPESGGTLSFNTFNHSISNDLAINGRDASSITVMEILA
tara:strand:- start:3168 stop:4205 length:1038 start_codon:yes stop_codon:yes gene_type:complete